MQLATLTRYAEQARPLLRNGVRRAKVAALRTWRSPQQRQRATVAATYVVLAAFAVAALDSMLTGSAPEWRPSEAYAMEVAPAQRQAPASAPVLAAAENLAPPLPEAVVSEIDYSVASEDLLGGPDTILASYEADLVSTMPEWFQGDFAAEFATEDKPSAADGEFDFSAGAPLLSGKDKSEL